MVKVKWLVVAAALMCASTTVGAQAPDDSADADAVAVEAAAIVAPQDQAEKPPTPPHTGIRALFKGYVDDLKHIPTPANGVVAAIGGVAALSLHPLDNTFNVHLRSHYDAVNAIYAPAKYYGDTPEQVG